MYFLLIKRSLPRFMAFPRRPQLSGEGDIRAEGAYQSASTARSAAAAALGGRSGARRGHTARRSSEPCVGQTVPGLRSVRFSSVPEQSP